MSISLVGAGSQSASSPIPVTKTAADANTASTTGLVFSGGFATYNGKPIALSDITGDLSAKFTDAQRGQADDTLLAREKAAYGQYEGTNTQDGNKKFVESYINYVQNLPPDEKDSLRYRGTLDSARNLLSEINNTASPATTTTKASDADEPAVVKILKGGETALQKFLKSSKPSGETPNDVVDLSPAAHAYLSQTSGAKQNGVAK
jgi:hypothetical protein